MTRIVTYHYKPPRKRRRKPAEAVEIAQRIVTATPRKKRQPVWQDDGEPVSEEVRDLIRRMMLRPPG